MTSSHSEGRDHRKKVRNTSISLSSAEKKWRKKKQGASHKGKARNRASSSAGALAAENAGLLDAQQGMRTVGSVKIVEVHCGISSDSLEYAWKSVQLAPISYNALVQWTLDSFLLSHLDPRDFQLVQRRDERDPLKDKLLPRATDTMISKHSTHACARKQRSAVLVTTVVVEVVYHW